MSAYIENVIKTTNDPEVTVFITTSAVSSEVDAVISAPVGRFITFSIAINSAQHRRPRFANDELATFIGTDFMTFFVKDGRINAEER